MAAKDDKSKTSKTARVMNLLSKKQDSAPSSEESGEAAANQQALPPIISTMAPDAAVSNQLQAALEDALDQEMDAEAAAAPAAEEAAPAEQPAPATEEPEPVPEPVQEAPAAPAEPPAAPTEPPVQNAEVSAPEEHPAKEPETNYVNVMQVLVEEKAEKYAKMFGVCTCDHCMADIKALALCRLPSKYVVMDRCDIVPRLTFYEGKYSSEIIAQLTKACQIVKETPHHSR